MANFASSKANRIPIQALQLTYEENRLSDFFAHRGPSPNGRKAIGCRLAFSDAENLAKRLDGIGVDGTASKRPFGDEFLGIRPNLWVMMNRVDRNRDSHSFRYVIIPQLIISRRHAVESIRSKVLTEDINEVWIAHLMNGGYIRSVSLITMSK